MAEEANARLRWDPIAFSVPVIALVLIFGRKWSSLRTLAAYAVLGLASTLVA